MYNTIDVCAICRDPLTSQEVTIISCMHPFHTTCINAWLVKVPSCPFCRTRVEHYRDYCSEVVDLIDTFGYTVETRDIINALETRDFTDETWYRLVNLHAPNMMFLVKVQHLYKKHAPIVNIDIVESISDTIEYIRNRL